MKKLGTLFLALAMVLSLAACGTGASSAAAAQSASAAPAASAAESAAQSTEATESTGVELEFQQWFDNEMAAGYLQGVCDAFTADTGISIKLLSNPYADTKTQIEASAAAGTMADIVALDGGWIYDYATHGHLADLDQLYETIGFDTADVSVKTAVNGITYAQPLVNFPSLMAVNQDLLAAAGVEQLPETWTELTAACKAVTDPANNVYGFGMNMSTDNATCMEFFASFLWNSGGTILTEDGKPYLADNALLAETTDFFKSLFTDNVVVPSMYSMTDADKVQEFVNGRIAFMPDSVAHLSNIREQAPDMDMTYIPMPHKDGYAGESFMRVNNWGVGISANSEHQEEAARFIAYLLGADVNADLCINAGGFPVNSTAKPAYTDDSAAFQAISDIYANSKGKAEFYSMPTAEALMTALDDDLVMYIDGDYASAEDMLAHTQSVFDAAYN